MIYFISYLIAINLITFIFFGIDKVKARKKNWRIPEKTLFILSFIGGSIGALFAMKKFRHKTQKSEFKMLFI
jgi:Predicted membrane protein